MAANGSSSQNYQIDELTLEGHDILPYMITMAVYENVFVNSMSISIDLVENENLPEIKELSGEQIISLKYFNLYDPVIPEMGLFEFEFDLYKIENVKMKTQGKKAYRIHGVNKDQNNNAKILMSRGYIDMSHSDIAEDVFSFLESDLSLEVEPSLDFNNLFVIPNLTPFQTINYLARTTFGEGPDYVFYQDREMYHFKSLKFLMNQPSVLLFDMTQMSLDWLEDMKKSPHTIIQYHEKKPWNTMENASQGQFANTFLKHNLLTNQWEKIVYENDEVTNRHGGEHNRHIYFHDNYLNHEFILDYKQQRIAKVAQRMDKRIVMRSMGNSDLKVGQCVDVELPTTKLFSMVDPAVSSELDPTLTGKYLIGKIKHEFTPMVQHEVIELVKVEY